MCHSGMGKGHSCKNWQNLNTVWNSVNSIIPMYWYERALWHISIMRKANSRRMLYHIIGLLKNICGKQCFFYHDFCVSAMWMDAWSGPESLNLCSCDCFCSQFCSVSPFLHCDINCGYQFKSILSCWKCI